MVFELIFLTVGTTVGGHTIYATTYLLWKALQTRNSVLRAASEDLEEYSEESAIKVSEGY